MPVTISFANMKGGVGKTTLCINLAYTFFHNHKKVLVVDNDPQFNATTALIKPDLYVSNYIKNDKKKTVYNIYEKPPRISKVNEEKINPNDFFHRVYYYKSNPTISLELIASRIELYETLRNPSQKDYMLQKFLNSYASNFDYIFIDCPPTPSVLTYSAFAASDYILIPVTPDYFATIGIPQFYHTLTDFKEDLHDIHNVTALGIIFTNVDRKPNRNVQRAIYQVSQTVRDLSFDVPVFTNTLSKYRVFETALWASQPVAKITGRGTHTKKMAGRELEAIANELEEKIRGVKSNEQRISIE